MSSGMESPKKKTRQRLTILDDAPVFYPTKEEFEDPLRYINYIRPLAELAGIDFFSWKLKSTSNSSYILDG